MLPALIARYRARRRYLTTVAQLSALSNRELDDIGVYRPDIERLVRAKVVAPAPSKPVQAPIRSLAYGG